MLPNDVVQPARAEHVERLADIERAAARLLAGHAPAHVLRDTTTDSALRAAANEGRLWVATVDDAPVGFALVDILAADLAHLEEVDVHPRHGQRGIGTALVREVCAWTRAAGFAQLTLTTFRAPRWNMPFYAGLGFVEVSRCDWRAELERVVANETARGLDPATRVVMVWRSR